MVVKPILSMPFCQSRNRVKMGSITHNGLYIILHISKSKNIGRITLFSNNYTIRSLKMGIGIDFFFELSMLIKTTNINRIRKLEGKSYLLPVIRSWCSNFCETKILSQKKCSRIPSPTTIYCFAFFGKKNQKERKLNDTPVENFVVSHYIF